ncbi:uncharacterized protein MYCGRDRAFT_94131 [Zymoseptoria tritici IPO323]|uniref:Uncharacterized protein n=1 Tax=Zymoseptoria tritici (strain CBS 115943 / IPO323) TaxID=336722 RepID=F9XE97_ZYMTI|nr:uncharacterized protein MYCGRDRAFT_94131 [Zymoseptoria tritici IPO323]EGP86685.1 hypothetical protein MYCGRDRAFT_94131 [Zymoseptoria tritici IPO323]
MKIRLHLLPPFSAQEFSKSSYSRPLHPLLHLTLPNNPLPTRKPLKHPQRMLPNLLRQSLLPHRTHALPTSDCLPIPMDQIRSAADEAIRTNQPLLFVALHFHQLSPSHFTLVDGGAVHSGMADAAGGELHPIHPSH